MTPVFSVSPSDQDFAIQMSVPFIYQVVTIKRGTDLCIN